MGRVRRATLVLAAGVIAFGALAGIAVARQASTLKMTAKLRSVKGTSAAGRFTGTLLSSSNGRSKLSWTLMYKHLSSHGTKAELVIPAKGKRGAVAVQLCRSCKASAHGVVSPILPASTKAPQNRTAWVIVSTKKYRKGEIRDRIARSH